MSPWATNNNSTMSVTYKDIDDLSQKSTLAGTEKLPVSDTEFITPEQIAGLVPIDSGTSRTSTNAIQAGVATRVFLRGASCTVVSDNTPGYMRTDGTVYTTASNYGYVLYSGIVPGDHYAVSTHFGTSLTTGAVRAVIWLDDNDSVISYSEQGNNANSTINYCDEIVIAPAGATKAAVNYHVSYAWSGTLKHVAAPSPDILLCTAQTLTNAKQAQARTNIGAGTSSFSGSYNDLSNKPTIPNITISSSEPTSQDGNDGDIWIVI